MSDATKVVSPSNENHFMFVKPISRQVRVRRGDTVLAESRDAIRIMETGKGVYDPVIYIPLSDATDALTPVDGKSTHCPLKGDASYYAFDGEEIAWTYDRPLEVSQVLKGHLSFNPAKVKIEEIGADA